MDLKLREACFNGSSEEEFQVILDAFTDPFPMFLGLKAEELLKFLWYGDKKAGRLITKARSDRSLTPGFDYSRVYLELLQFPGKRPQRQTLVLDAYVGTARLEVKFFERNSGATPGWSAKITYRETTFSKASNWNSVAELTEKYVPAAWGIKTA